MKTLDDLQKAKIVALILNGKLDEALKFVCDAYSKVPPKVRIGRVKGHDKALAVYDAKKETIFVSDGALLRDPFIMLHELYHHLRIFAGKHRGTEKHANRFAASFLKSHCNILAQMGEAPEWCKRYRFSLNAFNR